MATKRKINDQKENNGTLRSKRTHLGREISQDLDEKKGIDYDTKLTKETKPSDTTFKKKRIKGNKKQSVSSQGSDSTFGSQKRKDDEADTLNHHLQEQRRNTNQPILPMMIGTNSKSVLANNVEICNVVRKKLYPMLGVQWPYLYDPRNDSLILRTDDELSAYGKYEFAELSFVKDGRCLADKPDSPTVYYRFKKKTSQGKVVLSRMKIDGAEFTIVVKVDQVMKQDNKLWFNNREPTMLRSESGSSYRVISKSFVDAFCSIVFSRMVEQRISPHFPLCYATAANRVTFRKKPTTEDVDASSSDSPATISKSKRSYHHEQNTKQQQYGQDDIEGNPTKKRKIKEKKRPITKPIDESTKLSSVICQSIWMECLPSSMYEVFKSNDDITLWWSGLFQVLAALMVAKSYYGFIHNDLHSENVRVRSVPQKSMLYYELLVPISSQHASPYSFSSTVDITETEDYLRNNNIQTITTNSQQQQNHKRVYLAVPTRGFVFVLIDFGRSLIRPWKGEEEPAILSSVFGSKGECNNMVCDNPSIDMVRLVTSLEDALVVFKDSSHKRSILEFFRQTTIPDDGKDYFHEVAKSVGNSRMLRYMLESYPRKQCHMANPKDLLPKFFIEKFRIDEQKIPSNILPFKLSLLDD